MKVFKCELKVFKYMIYKWQVKRVFYRHSSSTSAGRNRSKSVEEQELLRGNMKLKTNKQPPWKSPGPPSRAGNKNMTGASSMSLSREISNSSLANTSSLAQKGWSTSLMVRAGNSLSPSRPRTRNQKNNLLQSNGMNHHKASSLSTVFFLRNI